MGLAKTKVPDKPTSGLLHGEQFTVQSATLLRNARVCSLKLLQWRGREYLLLQLLMPPQLANQLEGKRFQVSRESRSHNLGVDIYWPQGKQGRRTVYKRGKYRDGYAMVLEFGQASRGRLWSLSRRRQTGLRKR